MNTASPQAPQHGTSRALLAKCMILPLACGLALSSCHTVEAVVGAPPEFWLHVEAIGIAMWNDLVSLVELIL